MNTFPRIPVKIGDRGRIIGIYGTKGNSGFPDNFLKTITGGNRRITGEQPQVRTGTGNGRHHIVLGRPFKHSEAAGCPHERGQFPAGQFAYQFEERQKTPEVGKKKPERKR